MQQRGAPCIPVATSGGTHAGVTLAPIHSASLLCPFRCTSLRRCLRWGCPIILALCRPAPCAGHCPPRSPLCTHMLLHMNGSIMPHPYLMEALRTMRLTTFRSRWREVTMGFGTHTINGHMAHMRCDTCKRVHDARIVCTGYARHGT